MTAGRRKVLGLAAGAACLVVAVVWLVVVPGKADTTDGLQSFVIRYGHSIVWVLLGVAALLFARGAPSVVVGRVATSSLVVYAAFVLALLA